MDNERVFERMKQVGANSELPPESLQSLDLFPPAS